MDSLHNLHRPGRGILVSLWSFAFLSYLLRTNIAVAQQFMARELHLSDIQVGYVFSAFLIGYTLFQVPAGVLGDRFGPRIVLAISGLWWTCTTSLTGFAPGYLLKGSLVVLVGLLILRFLHGIGESSTYPVAMTAVADWFPPARHAFISSLIFTGSTLGAAFAPPLVSHVMTALGWRATFYLTAVLPAILALAWWRATRGAPRHQYSGGGSRVQDARNWSRLLADPNVLFLCLSYFLYCYAISIFVYWLFKYLVDVRHLSIVNSGWANSLPWIAASAVVPLLGRLSMKMSRGMGVLTARRNIAVACLFIAAMLMSVGVYANSIGLAIAAIAVSVALLFSTESSYWSTAIEVASEDAGAASGLMNLAGNLGGVVSTLLVPVLVARFDWKRALLSGSIFALLAVVTWFPIRKPAAVHVVKEFA